MSDNAPPPVTNAILLADQIITEAGSNKKTLVGVYSNIVAPRLPAGRPLAVFVECTDAEGRYDFDLSIVHLDTDRMIASCAMPGVRAENRLQPTELVIQLPVSFEAYGSYEIRIAWKGDVFARRRFRVMEAPNPTDRSGRESYPRPNNN